MAQYDLETRGPGDFFGSRQHGLPTLQIADLMNDTRTLHAAQSEALAMLAEDPLLQAPEHALLARAGAADVRQGRADVTKKALSHKNSCDSAFFTLFHSRRSFAECRQSGHPALFPVRAGRSRR